MRAIRQFVLVVFFIGILVSGGMMRNSWASPDQLIKSVADEDKEGNIAAGGVGDMQTSDPKSAEDYSNRGVNYAKEGKYSEAMADFNKAIEMAPKDSKVYTNRGLLYNLQGKYNQALTDLSKAIEINAKYGEAYVNRAITYFYLKDYAHSWGDVHQAQSLGNTVHPGFIATLEKASGKKE